LLRGLTPPARRLQEPLAPGHFQELVQLFLTQRLAEAFAEGGANLVRVPPAVELG
jgi:hypothetical protein